MADDPFALSTVRPRLAAEDDYDAIRTAVMATERGRRFLEEYARRNRNADITLVLAAMARIESAVRGELVQQAEPGQPAEVLDTAQPAAQAEREMAPLPPDEAEHEAAVAAAATSGALAAAERLQDAAWMMRERGVAPALADQVHELASAILATTSLSEAGDQRTQMLGEVLHHLERRIDSMLTSSAEEAGAPARTAGDRDALGAGNSSPGPTPEGEKKEEQEEEPSSACQGEDAAPISLAATQIEIEPPSPAEQRGRDAAPAAPESEGFSPRGEASAAAEVPSGVERAPGEPDAAGAPQEQLPHAVADLAPAPPEPAAVGAEDRSAGAAPAGEETAPTDETAEAVANEAAADDPPPAEQPGSPPPRPPARTGDTLALPWESLTPPERQTAPAPTKWTDGTPAQATQQDVGPASASEKTADITADIESELFAPPAASVAGATPPVASASDPLGALQALSEEERIALFT